MRRVALVLAAFLGAAAVTVAPLTAPSASAQARIVSVVVEGTGNGHGRGLSQYGAYGRAIGGQKYGEILNAYFGGTVPGDLTPSSQRIDVRLLALDNVADLKVISTTGAVAVTGVAETWGSVYAVEIPATNSFQLWGLKTATDCNADVTTFTDLGTHAIDAVEFTMAGGDDVNTIAADLLGVCRPNGSVVHYRGAIEFWDTYLGNRVVNSVLVEQYLRGVIPREVPASWGSTQKGMEALKAQAVAARSYALTQSRGYFVESSGGPTRYASTCDSSTCQVYGGAATRATGTSLGINVLENGFTNDAILATAREVRRWSQNGPIVSTEYSSSNGPRTAGGTFPVIDDPADATPSNKLHRWIRVLDAAVLAEKYGLGTLTSVTMDEAANPSNRLYDGIWYNDVVLTGTGGTKRVPAWTFRGDNGLPSPGFTLRTEAGPGGPMGANQRIELQVAGAALTAPDGTTDVVPTGVSAVALNITAVNPSAAGYMTVWPCDVGRPDASNLNYVANGVVANSVIASVGATGRVCFYTNQTSHLLVDISGWFSNSSFVGATPKRVVDTRNAIGGPKVRIPAGGTISVPLAGATVQRTNGTADVIPAAATAVAMNVTAVSPSRAGFFTVWPCGTAMPTTSNLNFTTGSVVANGVVATLGAGGSVCIYSDQQSDVLVDVLGWFGPGDGHPPYTGAVPSRIVDTRNAIGGPRGVITPGAPKVVPVRGVTVNVNGAVQQVPTDASAVALNVTVVDAREAGYATVWPCGTPRPEASNVNFARGGTVANGVIAPIGLDGSVCIFTYSDAHLIVDIAGWFTGGATPAFRGNVPERLVDTRNAIGPLPR